MINNIGTSDDAIRSLKEEELALVSGSLTMATTPVKAIRIFGLTAYVSNGELVGVGLPDGTIKTP